MGKAHTFLNNKCITFLKYDGQLNIEVRYIFLIYFEAKHFSIIRTPVPLSAQMPFANAAKATQNGITAAIGASLQTSVLRIVKKRSHSKTRKYQPHR